MTTTQRNVPAAANKTASAAESYRRHTATQLLPRHHPVARRQTVHAVTHPDDHRLPERPGRAPRARHLPRPGYGGFERTTMTPTTDTNKPGGTVDLTVFPARSR